MKQTAISVIIAFTFLILLYGSCTKEPPYMNDAIITGFDARMCICCGGFMITFNGETKPYIGDFKLIENGSDLGISDRDTFPIYLKVDWKTDTANVCKRIIITRSARRKGN